MIKINYFRGELTDDSAEKEALACSRNGVLLRRSELHRNVPGIYMIQHGLKVAHMIDV